MNPFEFNVEDGYEYKTRGGTNSSDLKDSIASALETMKINQSFVCPKRSISTLRMAIRDITALDNIENRDKIFRNNKLTNGDWRCFRLK